MHDYTEGIYFGFASFRIDLAGDLASACFQAIELQKSLYPKLKLLETFHKEN